MRTGWRRAVLVSAVAAPVLLLAACQDTPTSPAPATKAPAAKAPTPFLSRALYGEGYRAAGEVRTGWITGRDGSPMQVRYDVQGELAIWNGDIQLGKARDIAATREELLREVVSVF